MTKKTVVEKLNTMGNCCKGNSGSGNAVYGIGMIGSLVYFIQHSNGASEIIMGIVQSIFWPGILVYKAFELLGF